MIQHHPLSNEKLGNYQGASTYNKQPESSIAKFVTVFYYENGNVTLDEDWKYHTYIPTIEYNNCFNN